MRGNATLLALLVIATMTTASLRLWRLWSMHAAIAHAREDWYHQWFSSSTGFDGVVKVLQGSFDQYVQLAKVQKKCAITIPAGLQKAGVVSATMQYTTADLFLVTVTVAASSKSKNTIRFLVEKQAYAQSASHLLVHHVTFGIVI